MKTVLVLLLLSLVYAATAQNTTNQTSEYGKDFVGQRFLGRFWISASALGAPFCNVSNSTSSTPNATSLAPEPCTYTPDDVIATFLRGFAPIARNLTGFEEYMAVRPETNVHSLFINVYNTSDQAKNAQERAASFVANGTLAEQIIKDLFMEGEVVIHRSSPTIDAGNPLETGYFMNFHAWTVPNNTRAAVLNGLNSTHSSDLLGVPGFREYLVIPLDDKSTIVSLDIFETREQSLHVLSITNQFFATLNDTTSVLDMNGPIMFDIRSVVNCPPYPSGYTNAGNH